MKAQVIVARINLLDNESLTTREVYSKPFIFARLSSLSRKQIRSLEQNIRSENFPTLLFLSRTERVPCIIENSSNWSIVDTRAYICWKRRSIWKLTCSLSDFDDSHQTLRFDTYYTVCTYVQGGTSLEMAARIVERCSWEQMVEDYVWTGENKSLPYINAWNWGTVCMPRD